jgi:glutamyl endopeptidase
MCYGSQLNTGRGHVMRRLGVFFGAALLMSSLATVESSTANAQVVDPAGLFSSDGLLPLPSVDPDYVEGRDSTVYLKSGTGTGVLTTSTASTTSTSDLDSGYANDSEENATIIGNDDRYRVKYPDKYPNRTTVYLDTDRGWCTGWMAGKDMIVTAGHCLYDRSQGWIGQLRSYPGRDGSYKPFGSCLGWERLYVLNGWAWWEDYHYDVGYIKLNCSKGSQTGWLGARSTSTSVYNQVTYLIGYPQDKALATMWKDDGVVNGGADPNLSVLLGYTNDTKPGNSGGGVYNNSSSSCGSCTIAVHAYGSATCGSGSNCGRRVTPQMVQQIRDIRNS